MSYDFTNTLAQRVMERSAAPDGPAVLRQTQLTLEATCCARPPTWPPA